MKYIYNECIYKSFIINISRNGCFIEDQKPLPVREKILIHILLDGEGQSFSLNAEVVNTNRFGMGVEFKQLSRNLAGKIGNLLYNIL